MCVYLTVTLFTCPCSICSQWVLVGIRSEYDNELIMNYDKGCSWGSPILGPWAQSPGALKVAVKTLLRSREGSREAGLHVRSLGMVPWRVQGHTWGRGFAAFHHPGQQEIT